jgi:pimeloyl-ACP methyl ester carboxylesterase
VKRPPIIGAIVDPIRASGEFATSVGLLPFRSRLPGGNGGPVIVFPGFMAGDRSTGPMRRILSGLGYDVHGWGLGRNVGPTERVTHEMPAHLASLAEAAGKKVRLIGWSLGGVYARHLAARRPDLVESVVTLGTPVRSDVTEASNASGLFRLLAPVHTPGHPLLDEGTPLEVPVTAVHTRSDGIVHWETCIIASAPNAENLRVAGSHTGLGFNPAAVYVVADRLAQTDGTWDPLRVPRFYRGVIRHEPPR